MIYRARFAELGLQSLTNRCLDAKYGEGASDIDGTRRANHLPGYILATGEQASEW